MKCFQLYIALILLEIFVFVRGLGNKKLKYYEVIDSTEIKREVQKRSLQDDENHRKEMTLSVLGRKFELFLIPKPELFSENFIAVTVNEDGTESEFIVDKNDFYRGYVKGEEHNSSVTMELDKDVITAAIESQGDTYHLEPAVGKIDGDTKNKIIAYRDSDVMWNVTFAGNHTRRAHYCGLAEAGNRSDIDSGSTNAERERRSSRTRRDLITKRECSLTLVADYLYFKNIGQGDERTTTYSMVGVINRVDEIFKNTVWSDDENEPYTKFGFFIRKIIIQDKDTGKGYNRVYKPAWQIKDLLEEFSRNDWSSVCLAHLFTYQDFADGVIGLAYVAHPDRNSRGGICSEGEYGMWHNTGLSSSINWGSQLLTTEADIVTAHELGHNFGSEHDVQDDPICSPDSGGKYIMYPASVSGEKENNNKFSKCSKRAIRAVLSAKSSLCFSEPNQGTFCGNFRVDSGEECDPGNNGKDPCCDSDCKLKKNAKCSDTNAKCCSNCDHASKNTLCAQGQPLLCKKQVYCTGLNDICPKAEPAEEGTECIEKGKCNKEGKCEPFCKSLGAEFNPCLCEEDEDACYVCCRKGNDTCLVHRNSTSGKIAMSNGRLCATGVCRNQKCEKEAQDIITRLQDFFETLGDPSKFGEFLKDNIVGTVIFFSVIAWVPISIIVHRIDKRRDKQAQELAKWQDTTNQFLIRQPNKRRDHFDVVFKKDSVVIRDSRKARGRGLSPGGQRGPMVQ